MILRAPHLQDEHLLDCYYAERRGEAPDPPTVDHLSDCSSCRARYDELGGLLSTLRADADAELEAAFPAEKLRAQQHEIARRLEHIGRAARVISFPGHIAGRQAHTSTTPLTRRWVAAAAAAGLFVGVAAGTVLNFGGRWNVSQTARPRIVSSVPAMLAPSTAAPQAAPGADDAFMSDLESLLDRPHTSELGVYDALTPHVREIADRREFAR
jgi:hypothetical protein